MIKKLSSAVSISLINLVLMSSMTAFASPTLTITPEAKLVSQAIAIGAHKLSDVEAQKALQETITTYAATAEPEGRIDRLRAALVDMNVYSEAQADEFVLEAQLAADPVVAQANSSQEAQSAALNSALGSIQAPEGAQYSDCRSRAKVIVFEVGAALWLTSSIYVIADHASPTVQNSVIIGGFAAFATTIVLMNAFDKRKC